MQKPAKPFRKGFAGFLHGFLICAQPTKNSLKSRFGVVCLGTSATALVGIFLTRLFVQRSMRRGPISVKATISFPAKALLRAAPMLFSFGGRAKVVPRLVLEPSIFPFEQHRCLTEQQRVPISTSASLSRRKCALFTNEARNETRQ